MQRQFLRHVRFMPG